MMSQIFEHLHFYLLTSIFHLHMVPTLCDMLWNKFGRFLSHVCTSQSGWPVSLWPSPSPPPAPGNRWCLLPSTSFALSEMHHNWSHEVGGTCGLAFLTRRHDLAAHPRLCVYQVCSCILLDHLWRVVHGTEGPPCVHPSTSWRIFEGFQISVVAMNIHIEV